MKEVEKIQVETIVNQSVKEVWERWTKPEHIIKWNFASEEWCCTNAVNVTEEGKKFNWRMEAKDGSVGFDFSGTYNKVVEEELLEYSLDDGRNVNVSFTPLTEGTLVKEIFEVETIHSVELQKQGWQAILNNFKKYAEGNFD